MCVTRKTSKLLGLCPIENGVSADTVSFLASEMKHKAELFPQGLLLLTLLYIPLPIPLPIPTLIPLLLPFPLPPRVHHPIPKPEH